MLPRSLLLTPLALFSITSAPALAQCGPPLLQELAAFDPQQNARVGDSLGMDGDTLASGAPWADYDQLDTKFRGAAYIWREVAGTWTFEAKIPGPPSPYTQFGMSISVAGDTLIAGGFSGSYPYERAWIYRRTAGVWNQEAQLLPSDPLTSASKNPNDVAIEGDWAAVGHYVNSGSPFTTERTGAAYVYRFDGANWNQQYKLLPADSGQGDDVAWSLDLEGGVLAFNSRSTKDPNGPGRVLVYRTAGAALVAETTLTASSPQQGNYFGYHLDTDGTRIAVSDIGDTAVAGIQGAVYVFRFDNGTWVEEQIVRPVGLSSTVVQFGQEVAIDGDDLTVSDLANRVWHFRRVNGVWLQFGLGQAPAAPGFSVDGFELQNGVLAIGSPTTSLSQPVDGAVYVLDPSASQQVCTYCTGKLNTLGCTPTMAWSGSPSAGAASGFVIQATQVRPNMNGILFYGLGAQAASPFLGGTLCMQGQVTRTSIVNSGGTSGCSGSFAFDFNSYAAGSGDPQLVSGAVVRAQFWSRDPGASFGSSLTDAISFVIAP